MTALTRSQIVAVLGPVDDTLLAEIAATGASRAELMEAYGWVTNDEALVNEGHPLPAGRVATLVEVLQAAEESEDFSEPR